MITNLYTAPHSGSLLQAKIIKQNHMHTPSKKGKRWKKILCAEGTVAAVSIYETRNCISKRIQESSPLRTLLTRIHNKPHSIYMPLNWRALIKIIQHSTGFCPAKKSSQASDLVIPEVWSTPPAFWPNTSVLPVSHPFFPFFSSHASFCLFISFSHPLSLSFPSPIILLLIFQPFSPSTHISV